MDDAFKMRDNYTIIRVSQTHPQLQDDFRAGIDAAEAKLGPYTAIRVVQAFRSFAEQDALYAIGRTLKGSGAKPGLPMGHTVTNARAGQSYHNYGMAIDFAILYDKDKNGTYESLSWDLVKDMNRDGQSDWMETVGVFKSMGFSWGGDWPGKLHDNPHIQKKFGYTWQQLLQKYNAGQFITGTKFVSL